jgi:membrane protein DedA with SNARE-associated domain
MSCDFPGSLWSGLWPRRWAENFGFALGRHGGRPLIERYRHVFSIRAESLARGERLFERYGAATVFLARFLFGMRVLASLLAGALHMPWRKFTCSTSWEQRFG